MEKSDSVLHRSRQHTTVDYVRCRYCFTEPKTTECALILRATCVRQQCRNEGTLIAKIRTSIIGTLAAVFVSGCGSNITLDPPTIPAPLINKMSVSVALRIPADFRHFVHEEEILGREQWTIDLGSSNAALFEQLFGYMFDDVTIIGPDDDVTLLDIDALVEPSIEAFEFSIPNQSKTDAFAVWIRYRIKVYDRGGTVVSNWPVSAYGKSQTTTLGGSDALKRAAVLAMRDAAALMIMKLDDQTGISSMPGKPAQAKPASALPEPQPMNIDMDEDDQGPSTDAEDDGDKVGDSAPEPKPLPPPLPAPGPQTIDMDATGPAPSQPEGENDD